MRYVAAYLLATIGGKKDPSEKDVEKILSSVGIEIDKEKVKKVVTELKGKDVNTVIDAGKSKLSSMPAGGAVVASGAPAAAAAGGGGSPAKEEKKEAKKEESDESDDDMGFGLFD